MLAGLFGKKPSNGVGEVVLLGNQRSEFAFGQGIAGAGDIKAAAGVPLAIASRNAIPKPSPTDGITNRSAIR
jgi:hypothetical protein